MQKNWYLIYTKPKCEKKVASLLKKRKIENFFPQNRKQVKQLRKFKMVSEPLFSSYIFVNIERESLYNVLNLENVLSLVYWKGSPAVIKADEIDIIRNFIQDHDNIILERSIIDINGFAANIDRPNYSINGNLLTLKNKAIKVNLPSIGYTMIAQIKSDRIIGNNITFMEKELHLQ